MSELSVPTTASSTTDSSESSVPLPSTSQVPLLNSPPASSSLVDQLQKRQFRTIGRATAHDLVYYNPLGGPINNIVSRCVQHTLPFLDDGAHIRRLNNAGLNDMKIEMVQWGPCLDKTLATSLRSLLATRHIDQFLSMKEADVPYDNSEIAALRQFVCDWCVEVYDVHDRTSMACTKLRKLLSDHAKFNAKRLCAASEDEDDDPQALIVRNVKADITKVYTAGDVPEIWNKITSTLSNSSGVCTDVEDLTDWWTFLASHLTDITSNKGTLFMESLKRALPLIYSYLAPYVSQIELTVKETEHSTFKYLESQKVIGSAEYNLWKTPDPRRTTLHPSLDWRYLLDACSFTVIAKPLTIDVGGSELTHIVTSRITKLVKLKKSGYYGIQMRILAREQSDGNTRGDSQDSDSNSVYGGGQDDSDDVALVDAVASLGLRSKKKRASKATYRCTKMQVEWAFEQRPGSSEAAVVSFAPTSSNVDTVGENQKGKWTCASPDSVPVVNIPLPTVSYERSREMTVPHTASIKGVQLDNKCSWTLNENEKLKRGVVDCDVGVILMMDPNEIAMATSRLVITLDYETAWKGSWTMKHVFPTRRHSGGAVHKARGRTTIPFRIYSDLKLIKDLDGVSDEEFLANCGLRYSF